MKTAAQMKEELIEKVLADINVGTGRGQWPEAAARRRAEAEVHEAMKRSVCEGGKLPGITEKSAPAFSDSVTFFGGGGGFLLERDGGLPVSEEAALSKDWVVVEFNKHHCVMSFPEAFERGLSEANFEGVDIPTLSVKEVSALILEGIAGKSSSLIRAGIEPKKH